MTAECGVVSAAFGTSVEKSAEAIFAFGGIEISAVIDFFSEGGVCDGRTGGFTFGTKSALGTHVSQMILKRHKCSMKPGYDSLNSAQIC